MKTVPSIFYHCIELGKAWHITCMVLFKCIVEALYPNTIDFFPSKVDTFQAYICPDPLVSHMETTF